MVKRKSSVLRMDLGTPIWSFTERSIVQVSTHVLGCYVGENVKRSTQFLLLIAICKENNPIASEL